MDAPNHPPIHISSADQMEDFKDGPTLSRDSASKASPGSPTFDSPKSDGEFGAKVAPEMLSSLIRKMDGIQSQIDDLKKFIASSLSTLNWWNF
ncbi:uncharacterized protein DS421_16g553410 [Arachis hypogaea]|nr:uncharacterized protein DS421_16g553410 [Arachis hypogaea]